MKEEKERRGGGGGGEERRAESKWKDPTSQIAPITGTFRSQFLQKALAAVPQSFPLSFLCLLCPLLSLSPAFLSYDPNGVTIGEVLPAVSFPSVCECSLSQHPGSCESALECSKTHCCLLEEH